MSDKVLLNIDGKDIEAKEGETILNVARANNIFIPALCYLTRCTPTLACRLCLVEVDGKQVYACNSKVKANSNVLTITSNIVRERRAIMQVYDVNHPLECGVCDKSGECELQDNTLFMKVNSQEYSIKDTFKPKQNWGLVNYDPSLCIVCERCVTVCKDMTGTNALSTIKRGSEALSKDYKETMPKDAYSMWNKLNKSLIGHDKKSCDNCGECIAVCPVGALTSRDFQYTSNAWELQKIPAANPHCSDCAFLYYEVKHKNIQEHNKKKIYRVTNEFHYLSLNGAARFAFDFANEVDKKDEKAFERCIESFKKAKNIIFNSYITNEEACILQKIAKKTGAKLVNKEAKRYQDFLKQYSLISGKTLYSRTMKDIHSSNFVISVGSYLKSDLPNVKYAFNNSVVVNKGSALYFHPLEDSLMYKIGRKGKSTEFIHHKPYGEEAILYFILYKFGKDLPQDLKDFIDSKTEQRVKTVTETKREQVIEKVVDEETGEEKEEKKIIQKKVDKEVSYEYNTLLDEFGQDENFSILVDDMLKKKDKFSLIIGEDIITHPHSQTLAKLCGFIDKYTPFDVLIIPTCTNTLGVSLLCNLEDEVEGFSVGYNEKADFQLSALGDGDLDIPALNQQEGTFVNIDKKLIPTNVALPFKGYTLNEIANKLLDEDVEYTIEYTHTFPKEKGFKNIDFDSLSNHFGNDSLEYRGYDLENIEVQGQEDFSIGELKKFPDLAEDEYIIYRANPINQFNEFTAKATKNQGNYKSGIFFSEEMFKALELEENSKVEVLSNTAKTCVLNAFCDIQINGKIAYISTFEKNDKAKVLFDEYRYNIAKIKKV